MHRGREQRPKPKGMSHVHNTRVRLGDREGEPAESRSILRGDVTYSIAKHLVLRHAASRLRRCPFRAYRIPFLASIIAPLPPDWKLWNMQTDTRRLFLK